MTVCQGVAEHNKNIITDMLTTWSTLSEICSACEAFCQRLNEDIGHPARDVLSVLSEKHILPDTRKEQTSMGMQSTLNILIGNCYPHEILCQEHIDHIGCSSMYMMSIWNTLL